jgi:hypothetical protein
MSIVRATFDIINKTWSLTEVSPAVNYIDLQFNWISNSEETSINNFKFGYILTDGNTTITEGIYPTVGNLEFAKNTPLITNRILMSSNTEFLLDVWSEYESVRIDARLVFSTPRPLKPYESWTWNGETWVAPIPMPEIGPQKADGSWDSYVWSEKQQKWFLMTPPLHQYDDI